MIGGGIFNHAIFSPTDLPFIKVVERLCFTGIIKTTHTINGILIQGFGLVGISNPEIILYGKVSETKSLIGIAINKIKFIVKSIQRCNDDC